MTNPTKFETERDEACDAEVEKWSEPIQRSLVRSGFKAGFDACRHYELKRSAALVDFINSLSIRELDFMNCLKRMSVLKAYEESK